MKKNILKFTIYTFIFGPLAFECNDLLIYFGIGLENEVHRFIGIFLFLQIMYTFLVPKVDPFFEQILFREAYSILKLFIKLNSQLNSVLQYTKLISELRDSFKQFPESSPIIVFIGESFDSVHPDFYIPSYLSLSDINSEFKIINKFSDNLLPFAINDEKLKSFIKTLQLEKLILEKQIKRLILLKNQNSVVGFVLIPYQLEQHFHVTELKRVFENVLKKLADISVKTRLIDDIEKRSLQMNLLNEVAKKINSSLELKDVLKGILDGLKQLINYDAAGIFLQAKKNKTLEKLVTIGYDEDRIEQFRVKLDSGVTHWVMANKQMVIIPDVRIDNRYYSARPTTQSQITVPIYNEEEVIGSFTLEKDQLNFYTESDAFIMETFAEQAGIAIVNAQLYQDSEKKRILEEEMVNASSIQTALLPKRAPKIDFTDIALLNKPCKFVGGDVFDLIKLANDRFFFSIGDVSGKGSPAAILMAVLFAGLRSQTSFKYQVSEHNAHLNNLLYNTTGSAYYATFFIGYIDIDKRHLQYSNAGHTPPFLLKQNDQIINLNKGGMVLGFIPNEQYLQDQIALETGDIVVAFTDGIDESFDDKDNEFGVEAVQKIVQLNKHKSSVEIKNAIIEAVEKHHGFNHEFDDDITLIVIKINFDQ